MNDKSFDVLCFGEISCDIIFAGLDKLPLPGREEYCKYFDVKAGGSANTPMALSRLGIKTLFATCLGEDRFSLICKDFLDKYNVRAEAIHYDSKYKAAVSAVLSTTGDRGFATYGGSGIDGYPLDKLEKMIAKSKHVHTFLGYAEKFPILEFAKSSGASISLDTSWCEGMRIKDIKKQLDACDIFKPNELEACEICQTQNPHDALDMLADFTAMPVISLGENGVIARKDKIKYEFNLPYEVQAQDTTGAGDLFAAGLIYSYLKGDEVEDMLKFACASGSLAVSFFGGMDDTYTLENINKYLKQF